MGRYESKLKNLIGITIKGYGIGYIISLILGCFISGGFSWDMFGNALVLDVIIGSSIAIYMATSSGMQNSLATVAINAGKGMLGSAFSAGFGWGFGMVISICKLVIFGMIALALFLFAAISYPLTLIYTAVMYLIERKNGEIDETMAELLDKVVPVIAAIVTAIALFALL